MRLMISKLPTKKSRGDSKRPPPVFPPSSTGTTAETEGRALRSGVGPRLGPWSRGEGIVLAVFVLVVGGWMLRPWIAEWTGIAGLSDPVITMIGAIALVAIPVDPATRTFAMDWDTARRLP